MQSPAAVWDTQEASKGCGRSALTPANQRFGSVGPPIPAGPAQVQADCMKENTAVLIDPACLHPLNRYLLGIYYVPEPLVGGGGSGNIIIM